MAAHHHIAFIGIGSNKGDRTQACIQAIEALGRHRHTRVIKVSSFYESEPWGYAEQERFINCAARLSTSRDAFGLFAFLQETEQSLGKQQDFYWGPRTIDLDLLFFNQEIIEEPHLKIPHPLLHQRRFVLEPLSELEPHWIHPVFQQPVCVLLEQVEDSGKVFRLISQPQRVN